MKIIIFCLALFATSVQATSLALYNFTQGNLESSHRHEEIVPIASVTKLFTAAAVLESGVDLNARIKVTGNTRGMFNRGRLVSRLDLLKAMLISSDNLAADSLAHAHPGGYAEFIRYVNDYIDFIGLKHTKIFDASGLSVFNVSTAEELVNFAWYLRRFPLITEISSKANDNIELDNSKNKTVKLQLRNTNPDINKYDVLVSKTGFTSAAGRCLVMLVRRGEEVFGVAVLGFKNPRTRSEAIAQLINLK